MKFGLDDATLQKLSEVFEANPKVDQALVFGSRAKGNYREDSDIDIALKGYDLTPEDVLALSVALEDAGVSQKVDLVAYSSIQEPALVAHIDRVGTVLYSRWKEYRFADLLVDESISYGIVQPGQHTELDSVPVLRVNNLKGGKIETDDVLKVASAIENNYKRTRLSGGELLIAVVGNVGATAIVPTELCGWNVARAISVAKIKAGFSARYIQYALRSEDAKYQLYGHTNDTVQPTLNLSSLKELKLPIPQLSVQLDIAYILGSLDDKIDLLDRQSKTLEALADVLFREWFVEKGNNNLPGILGDVIDLIYGKALKEEVRTGKGYPVVGSSGIISYHNEFLVRGPGIVIGRKGTLGSVTYLFDNFHPIDTTYYVKPKSHSSNPIYEYFLLKSLNLGEMNSDSAVPGLNRDSALRIEIKVPNQDRVVDFNRQNTVFFEKIRENSAQIRLLTQMRDTLLPKLMSGELRIKLKN